jgi:hypothetical protein
VAEASWPPATTPRRFFLTDSGLAVAPATPVAMPVCSPEDCGAASGTWCPHGLTPDMPLDQREDDAKSLVFDTPPLAEALGILGAPVLELALSADRPNAKLIVRLCEVHPGGASTRVTYGVLNLTHRDSHEHPRAVVPGETMHVRLALNDTGYSFAAGSRIRVAVSSTYWPLTWPSPERVTLHLVAGPAVLTLPERRPAPADAQLPAFPPAEIAPRLPRTVLRPGKVERVATHDHATGERRFVMLDDTGRTRLDPTGMEFATLRRHEFSIRPDAPLSARAETLWEVETGRGAWQTRSTTRVTMTATASAFLIVASLDAYEGDERVCSRDWHEVIPRDLV